MNEVSSIYVLREGPGAEQSNADLSRALNEWLTSAGPSGVYRTCGSCRHMEQAGPAACRLYGVTPPVSVILAGCEHHVDEAVAPFP